MGLKTDKNWTCNLVIGTGLCNFPVGEIILRHEKIVERIHILFPNTQEYIRPMLQVCIIDMHLNFQNVDV